MSIFNPEEQNKELDNKIVAGLERLSMVFRVLLWEKAKFWSLSPIQIQIIIFISNHTPEKSTVSYLSKEFNLTKPTISDAVRILESKEVIEKIHTGTDGRSYQLKLTQKGVGIVQDCDNYTDPLSDLLVHASFTDKEIIWNNIFSMIQHMYDNNIISIQRSCKNCNNYAYDGHIHFCRLLKIELLNKDLRIDCSEFIPAVVY